MKPSERIKEIIRANNNPPTTDPVMYLAHCAQAITNYLDEQYERNEVKT